MKTETQLKAEIYNTISPIINTSWISDPKQAKTFPLCVYYVLDNSGMYSYGIKRSAEDIVFQLDLYFNPDEVVESDNLFDQIKAAMESIDYRLMAAPEFLDTDLNKVHKATRWERYNV